MRTVVALFLAFVFSLGSWAAEPSVLITPRGYYLLLLDADGAPRIVPAHVIDLRGDQPLPPTPVPPQPNPPQPPVPPQPVAGPRWIAIIHESAQATPEWSRLVVELRKEDSEAARYLASKGHALQILDQDLPTARAWLEAARRVNPQLALPALIVADPRRGLDSGVLYAGSLDVSDAAHILEVLKQHGG
ncbi:MAG: hypothetical protein KatS3mg038_3294 [Candidatus Kapaibacterium sp.]|nr:MAG: hypothetical protein KatS3mg038_1422 [Candidatus Kapabacteria bacterium]GIV52589.1 MAG: hypothetical protein KatS3mg038_3110 [Candidatus Kapabacteria bacterium]GIV52773.1 MAG: hypothetical protein KatS3mg038_3294 [Candidatus Kapabacteria bacterium]